MPTHPTIVYNLVAWSEAQDMSSSALTPQRLQQQFLTRELKDKMGSKPALLNVISIKFKVFL